MTQFCTAKGLICPVRAKNDHKLTNLSNTTCDVHALYYLYYDMYAMLTTGYAL